MKFSRLLLLVLAVGVLIPVSTILADFVFVVEQRTWNWEGEWRIGTENWKCREEIRLNAHLRQHLFDQAKSLRDFDPTEMWISMTSPMSRRFIRWALKMDDRLEAA